MWRLPNRQKEGYGIAGEALDELAAAGVTLVVTVDCGIGAQAEVAHARELGLDVIVTDHHEPIGRLPECVVIDPKLGRYPFPHLAGVGVALKLAHALLEDHRGDRVELPLALRPFLDVVAVGTVADVVPLVDENRILVKAGLERLPHTQKAGLRALMDEAGVPDVVSPYHIGFRIAPRLNAAGRLADAMAALELLLTGDPSRAKELAVSLDEHNAERQHIEEHILEEATTMARAQARDNVFVLAKEGWHVGVIGIVASRIQQEFYRPTVVIGIEDNLGKGSCRSIAGFSMVDALRHCAPLLERFGGHEMAAGLSVNAGNIDALREKLNAFAATVLKDEDRHPRLKIDAVVTLGDLDADFFEQLERLEPCGTENPTPVFAAEGVQLRGAPRVVGKNHLRFSVTDGDTTVQAIWWGRGDVELPKGKFDVAFIPEINEFRGVESVQLKVKDVRG